jgi:hypothetical protein
MIEAPFTRRFLASLNPAVNVREATATNHAAEIFQHFSYIQVEQYRVPVWTLFYGRDVSREKLRLMRIHLWRIHNEREVLKVVLSECIQHHLDPSHPALRDYLARQSATLRQSQKEGFPQASLLSHAYALDELVHRTEITELGGILRDVSPGLAASVLPLTASSSESPPSPVFITVNGNLQVAGTIGGHASVTDSSFRGNETQVVQTLHHADLDRLADELSSLTAALNRGSPGQDQQADIKRVRQAEKAARRGRKRAVLRHLARTGKWVQEVAAQVGAELVVAVIKATTGMK